MIPSDKYNILDFFPDCMLPDCPLAMEGPHQHILPKQQEILESDTKYTYIQGGVGGGKTTAIAACCVYLAVTIPNNEGVVARYNYDDLFESSWKAIQDCIDRLVDKDIIPRPLVSKSVMGVKTQYDFQWNGSQIKAIQGKNWRRGLGSNKGFFWVDDAYECLLDFFIGTDVSAGLLSRLRLPNVLFDKSTYNKETCPHGALRGYVSTNPPPIDSFLHQLFGKQPGVQKLGDDSITWIRGDTGDNPFLGTGYATGLIAVQKKMGRNDNNIQRVIHGMSIPAYGGIPVFPQFDHGKHVAPLKFRPDLPLIRTFDFGFRHPAVVYANLYKCKYGTNHYFALSETADCFSATVEELYNNYVVPHTKQLYKDAKLIVNCGDRSGYRDSSSNKDKRGDMKILMYEHNIQFKWRYINLVPSLQYMRKLLRPQEPCKCGMELVLVSNKCEALIGALEGGYKYPKPRVGPHGEKPTEDGYFADVACAWRYGAENYVKWGVSWEDQKDLRQQNDRDPFARVKYSGPPHLAWMDQTDQELAKMLV
jgi:hypothetical protein